MTPLEITSLFDKEVIKTQELLKLPLSDDEIKNHQIINALGKKVEEELLNAPRLAFVIFQALFNFFDQEFISGRLAKKTLHSIQVRLEIDIDRLRAKSDGSNSLESLRIADLEEAMICFKTFTIAFTKKKIYQEFENDDLPKQLRYVKLQLSSMELSEPVFLHEAYLELEKEIQQEIELKKEEVLHRLQLNVSEQDKESPELQEKQHGFPPYARRRIIETAVRMLENSDSLKDIDLQHELDLSKSTYDRQKKFFKLKIQMIRDEARAIIREKEK